MAVNTVGKRRSLLSSGAVIQAPWVKVTIGEYTFGVFSRTNANAKDNKGYYTQYNVQYPNYIQSLSIDKYNGAVNQYYLSLQYPVRPGDDPNFFEKVFSAVSGTRKIVFSYGDAMMPTYVFKEEEAVITEVKQTFNFGNSGQMGSVIGYQVKAISTVGLSKSGCFTFSNSGLKKPSDEIKRVFLNKNYGLEGLFTGMSSQNIDSLIDGTDKAVALDTKINISPFDYIIYLVSCMVPAGSTTENRSPGVYTITVHDDTIFDTEFRNTNTNGGPYFKVEQVSSLISEHADAFEIDLGWNGSTIVTHFQVDQNENYSLLYDYQASLAPGLYVEQLNDKGDFEKVFAPANTSKNDRYHTRSEDIVWWTKVTQFPVKATITVQGLIRPVELMSYIRLNIIFPGGRKHINSGLYIVTSQKDQIDPQGYRTTLTLTRIAGDTTNPDY